MTPDEAIEFVHGLKKAMVNEHNRRQLFSTRHVYACGCYTEQRMYYSEVNMHLEAPRFAARPCEACEPRERAAAVALLEDWTS